MSDEELIDAAAEETRAMEACQCEFAISLTGPEVIRLVGNLQLALRHPGNTGRSARAARAFIAAMKARFAAAGYNAYAELIERGNNPAHDQPREERKHEAH